MAKKKLLLSLVLLMLFMFAVNTLATKFYWYYSLWWFDIPMHFFGGFWVGLFFIYVFFRKESSLKSYWSVIMCTLLMGILWELFEVLTNQYIARLPFDILDTASDVLLDVLGGGFAAVYFFKMIMPAQKNTI